MIMDKNLILVELNEINFDVVKLYLDKNEILPGFEKLFSEGVIETSSEDVYDLLEPWIQWPSVHIGKKFEDHKIFRLGDMVNSNQKQIFEKVEEAGYKVGAISPMNTKNNLICPAYFIPDPWTSTESDGGFLSKKITEAISQAVNDNAKSKITLKSIFFLMLSFVTLVNYKKYLSLFLYALSSFSKPWRKALFLDLFLFEIHLTLYKRRNPNFSTVFLNAGAHIQHHYFFNSSVLKNNHLSNPSWYMKENEDPILDMIKCYDNMISELFLVKDTEFIIATGLSQKPYDAVKFYYRLNNHQNFLSLLNIDFKKVQPRMTRDFLIEFHNEDLANKAQDVLSSIKVDNQDLLFKEIDNRGKDLFVTLSYPKEITDNSKINIGSESFNLKDHVTFVAIKNGMHSEKGFAYFSSKVRQHAPENGDHVSNIFVTLSKFFNIV